MIFSQLEPADETIFCCAASFRAIPSTKELDDSGFIDNVDGPNNPVGENSIGIIIFF